MQIKNRRIEDAYRLTCVQASSNMSYFTSTSRSASPFNRRDTASGHMVLQVYRKRAVFFLYAPRSILICWYKSHNKCGDNNNYGNKIDIFPFKTYDNATIALSGNVPVYPG
tara:strand:+ start:1255 stop:1587 length:333 start_codon:yes stop_codon:yes gene_type:complete